MLDRLFVAPAVSAIVEAIRGRAGDRVAVVGNARLAAGLASDTCSVVAVGVSARAAKRLREVAGALTELAPRSLGAVVLSDIASRAEDAWLGAIQAAIACTRVGGAVVLVDRGAAIEASRRTLCAGLTELEQRRVGRVVVTSGLVADVVGAAIAR